MAITDINISDTLETSAPSIKYEGNEGPKSPEEQQQMMMAQLEEEYAKYVFEMEEQGLEPMSLQRFIEQAMAEGQMTSAQPMPNRQMAAYGGIMDVGGRKRYGLGSRLRKLIPNEVARVAEVAAPFVAPFNPIAGGLMAGVGGFDRTGSIGKSLKSGLMTYGGGQLARGIGGGLGNLQTGFNPLNTGSMQGMGSGLTKYFSNPMQSSGGLGKVLSDRAAETGLANKAKMATESTKDIIPSLQGDYDITGKTKIIEEGLKKGTSGIMDFINKNSTAILLGSMGIAAATATPQDMQEAVRVSRGTGLDIDKIRAEVQEAFEAGEDAWNELKRTKYPYMGQFSTKKAEGGRIGLYAGGQSIPSDYTMEDARKTSMQDKMGGITDVMKQADLYRQGDVGQMYMAEGGLMDLGGMEKDYRNDGGFVPLGGKEKADDVPARLSKNEFVFTADAVRAAGGGDIDQGAEVMEKVMKNLEQGGQISEETQGLSGAREMFDVSERLSEVV